MEESTILESKLKIIADQATDAAEISNMLQFLVFRVANKNYGIDILEIHEILKPIELTRLPNVSSDVLGVINLRGNIIPVVDLQMKFFGKYTAVDEDARIIVGTSHGKNAGLLVSGISEVARIKKEEMEANHMEVVTDQHISGVGRVSGKVFLVINLGVLHNEIA